MTSRTSRALLLVLGAALALPAGAFAAYPVTFVLDLRAEIAAGRFDPTKDGAGVRGGTVPLSWDQTLPATDADGDGLYEVAVTFPRAPFGGQAVAYKFKPEIPANPGAGWEEGRNRQLVLRPPAVTVRRAFNAPPEPVALSRVGTIRVHKAFASQLVAPRDVQVYLPPGYEREKGRRYPVLYLHDGQNVFDGAEAGMEWQVDETAQALLEAHRLAPVIVVAVSNSDERTADYTPTAIERKRPDGTAVQAGGKAGLYGRFLIEELKPFIDRTYRTRKDAANTAVGGASLGGLVSLWLAIEHPDVFGAALAVSPSAWWDGELLARKVAALPKKLPLKVWVDIGSLEDADDIAAVRRLRDALEAKGWKPGADLAYVEQEGGQHDEISWASRVEGMLVFLYGKKGR